MLDCKKMHHKCQAACCGVCPIPAEIFDRNKEKIVREIVNEDRFQDGEVPLEGFDSQRDIEHVFAQTESGMCCFLNADYSCNIYEDRPNVCRKFGDETHAFLKCRWLNKDGKERSRQERRSIERKIFKEVESLKKNMSKLRLVSSLEENTTD